LDGREEKKTCKEKKRERIGMKKNEAIRAGIGGKTERDNARRTAERERREVGGSSFMASRTRRSGDEKGTREAEGGRKRHA
jgi:hypothetical protein